MTRCSVLPLPRGYALRKAESNALEMDDKIVFWYRPEGAALYRVLYGDLHVSDVTEDKHPEKPKP
jgi:hypothetical protein